VVEDVISSLKLRTGHRTFKLPCFRKNIFYDIQYKDALQDEVAHLKAFIETSLGSHWGKDWVADSKAGCGIVYCRTREVTESLAMALTKRGLPCLAYHAGLKDRDRSQVQEDWMDGKVPVITATISFGMGVDKASVRFVAHWSVPQSVAAYYQESGRAGRDGRPSWARVYYGAKERDAQAFLTNMEVNKASKNEARKKQKQAAVKAFEVMVKYCESVGCRHALFSKHFGDSPPRCEGRCDACKDKKASTARLEAFQGASDRTLAHRTAIRMDADPADMYGEGRRGQKREADSYGGDSDDGAGGEKRREREARGQRENQIRQQFEVRKKKRKTEEKQKVSLGHARVKAAEFTEKKIAGLDLKTREDYLGLVTSSLTRNQETTATFRSKEQGLLSTSHLLEASVEEEYKVFTTNKVITMYRKRMAQVISGIKKETEGLQYSSILASFTPAPEVEGGLASLASSAREEVRARRTKQGQEDWFASCQEDGTSSQEPEPSTSSQPGKAKVDKSKDRKSKGFRMKRETKTQKTIANFFKVTEEDIREFENSGQGVDEEGGAGESDTNEEGDRMEGGSVMGSVEVCLPCPLCLASFPLDVLEQHAASCQGEDAASCQGEDRQPSPEGKDTEKVGKNENTIEKTKHALSSSEDEQEGPPNGGAELEESKIMKQDPSRAFLATRDRWREKWEGGGDAKETGPAEQDAERKNKVQEKDDTKEHVNGIKQDPEKDLEVGGKQEVKVKDTEKEQSTEPKTSSGLQNLLEKMKKDMEEKDAREKKERDEKMQREKELSKAKKSSVRSRRGDVLCDKEEAKDPQRKESKSGKEEEKHNQSRKRLQEKLNQKRKEMVVIDKAAEKQPKVNVTVDPEEKKKVADELVRCLAPHLKSGSIASKAAFKVLARELTHAAVRRGVAVTREAIATLVASFFRQQKAPVVEEEARRLVTEFRIP